MKTNIKIVNFISLFFVVIGFFKLTSYSYAMANPASVFCEKNGGRLEIRDETAGQTGYCIFPDGTECEEWSYYRKCSDQTVKSDDNNRCLIACPKNRQISKSPVAKKPTVHTKDFFQTVMSWFKSILRIK